MEYTKNKLIHIYFEQNMKLFYIRKQEKEKRNKKLRTCLFLYELFVDKK